MQTLGLGSLYFMAPNIRLGQVSVNPVQSIDGCEQLGGLYNEVEQSGCNICSLLLSAM